MSINEKAWTKAREEYWFIDAMDDTLREFLEVYEAEKASKPEPMDLTTVDGIKRVMGNDMPLISDRVDIEWIKRLRAKTRCGLYKAKKAWDLLNLPQTTLHSPLNEAELEQPAEMMADAGASRFDPNWPFSRMRKDEQDGWKLDMQTALTALMEKYELRRKP